MSNEVLAILVIGAVFLGFLAVAVVALYMRVVRVQMESDTVKGKLESNETRRARETAAILKDVKEIRDRVDSHEERIKKVEETTEQYLDIMKRFDRNAKQVSKVINMPRIARQGARIQG